MSSDNLRLELKVNNWSVKLLMTVFFVGQDAIADTVCACSPNGTLTLQCSEPCPINCDQISRQAITCVPTNPARVCTIRQPIGSTGYGSGHRTNWCKSQGFDGYDPTNEKSRGEGDCTKECSLVRDAFGYQIPPLPQLPPPNPPQAPRKKPWN